MTKRRSKKKDSSGKAILFVLGLIVIAPALGNAVGGTPAGADAPKTKLASSTSSASDGCVAQAQANYDAGFRGRGLVRSIAESRSEGGPGCPTTATRKNGANGIDRGPFQINGKYHPEVSERCARNRRCAADTAYRVSKSGTDWHEWYGPQGPYLKYAEGLAAGVSK